MRYASIREMDVSNGEGIGISLFVQGCHFHCKDCFNHKTWDFNGGKEWTEDVQNKFLELADKPYIKRISVLGGEPLAKENLDGVLKLLNKTRLLFGNSKSVWLYTGYELNLKKEYISKDDFWNDEDDEYYCYFETNPKPQNSIKLNWIIQQCDVIVDGRFEKDKLDPSLPYRGSSNQRLIDVQKTLKQKEIILYEV